MNINSIKKFFIVATLLILTAFCGAMLSSCTKTVDNDKYNIYVNSYTNGVFEIQDSAILGETITATITPDVGYWLKEDSFQIFPYISFKIDGDTVTFVHNVRIDLTISLEFEYIAKTYKYDYQGATSNKTVSSLDLTYDNLHEASFVIPTKENCVFDGWYLGDEPFGFFKKVTDEYGNLVIDYEVFYNPFKTLFAKWIAVDAPVYPVLMVYVDEIQATLETVDGISVEINYKMSEIEKRICDMITEQVTGSLQFIFNGVINIEVDSYYTTTVVGKESFTRGVNSDDSWEYSVYADNIPEVGVLIKKYRSVITTFSMNDDSILHGSAGIATNTFAAVYLDTTILHPVIVNNHSLESLFDFKFQGKTTASRWEGARYVYVHEFTHTIEQALKQIGQPVYEYHDIPIYGTPDRGLSTTKQYLLNTLVFNGKIIGIPFSYWKGELEIIVNYYQYKIDEQFGGEIFAVIGDDFYDLKIYDTVPFGSNITIEAIPYEGYRFVKWSDGVMTARRHDKNIIARLDVQAIFEKIT